MDERVGIILAWVWFGVKVIAVAAIVYWAAVEAKGFREKAMKRQGAAAAGPKNGDRKQ